MLGDIVGDIFEELQIDFSSPRAKPLFHHPQRSTACGKRGFLMNSWGASDCNSFNLRAIFTQPAQRH